MVISDTFCLRVGVGEHVCHVVIQMATVISHSLFYPVAYPCLQGKRQSARKGNLPVPAHENGAS